MSDNPIRRFPVWLWLLSAALACVFVTSVFFGRGGCRSEPAAENDAKDKKDAKDKLAAKDKEKVKPKADFEAMRLQMIPGDPQDLLRALKPGHWTSAALATQANNFDFKGDLSLRTTDREGHPLSVDGTPYTLAMHRPVVLPKGQKKQLEVTLFVPGTQLRPWVLSQLRDNVSRIEVRRDNEQVLQMPSFQYNLLILARDPQRYRFLRLAESVHPATDMMVAPEDAVLYRVIAPRLENRAPVPGQALLWTSVAYLFWDDASPHIFDRDQEQALIDWLHWGGHLVISGPASLDALRGSFLAPYLPVASVGSREITAGDLAELARVFHVSSVRPGRDELKPSNPWPGIAWKLEQGGTFLANTGELVAERRVGRGRVVVTAFPLSQPELIKWRGFDGFLNACLLRHGPRAFLAGEGGLRRTEWLGNESLLWNPREATHLRYFTRDSGSAGKRPRTQTDENDFENFGQEIPDGGAAAWNDFGTVPSAARKSLRDGAGIVIPRPSFVLWVLGLYLLVLVPVNWTFFRLLGRVEWAWWTTPVVAVSFAALVIWLAQLDIGFARSSTELAVVELQGDYPRAHLSRYTALYASLSTAYDLHYEAPSTVAQPFPAVADFALLRGQTRYEVTYERDEGMTLTGLEVASNSTSMVHSESMWDVGGGLSWHEPEGRLPEVVNHTSLTLKGVSIVRRRPDDNNRGRLETAWVGDLSAGQTAVAVFGTGDDDARPRRAIFNPQNSDGLNLAELVNIAEDGMDVEQGEVRLVGWYLDDLPGLDIQPAGPRRRHAAMVVAHLARQHAPAPQPDVWRTPADFQPFKLPTDEEPAGETGRQENPPPNP